VSSACRRGRAAVDLPGVRSGRARRLHRGSSITLTGDRRSVRSPPRTFRCAGHRRRDRTL